MKIVLVHASLLLGAIGLIGACGTSAGDYCQKFQECQGGNEMDLDACSLSEQAEADLADLHNCGSEYDEFFACKEENSRCNNKTYQVDSGTCDKVAEAYNKCRN